MMRIEEKPFGDQGDDQSKHYRLTQNLNIIGHDRDISIPN